MRSIARFFLILSISLPAYGGLQIRPTTTLAAETSNNTSGANSFVTQSNGNAGVANISKLPIRSLLYPGATTKIYAHWMPWFGTSYHMNVGYRSDDPAQIRRQVEDMISRGIDGTVNYWAGPKKEPHHTANLNMLREAELHPGFEVAVQEDKEAVKKCAETAGCDVTQQVINDLNFMHATFFPSPAYMRIARRPVVFFFGMSAYPIDWDRVRANVLGNPLFIFRNSGGFTHVQTNGAFSWLATQSRSSFTDGYMSLGHLDSFYTKALAYPGKSPFGSGFPGFDDSLASWGEDRYIGRYCGQTWLQSLGRAGKYYSAANQLAALQIVTWNDYEEGSEVETGIDNCLSVGASVSGMQLNWTLSGAGQESTIDHYRVYISTNGADLMKLAELPGGSRSLDLSGYSLTPGVYYLYVQAYGKPSIRNQMSGRVTLSVTNAPPQIALEVTPVEGQVPLPIQVNVLAFDPDGELGSSQVSFGDGTSADGFTLSHTYSTAGSYSVTVRVTDNLGASATASASVTAVVPGSVTISAPLPGSSVTSPVRLLASATSPVGVGSLEILLDGKKWGQVTGASIDTFIRIGKGKHRITVRAYDKSGRAFEQSVSFAVTDLIKTSSSRKKKSETLSAPLNETPVSGKRTRKSR